MESTNSKIGRTLQKAPKETLEYIMKHLDTYHDNTTMADRKTIRADLRFIIKSSQRKGIILPDLKTLLGWNRSTLKLKTLK
jgi:hypothetical protein